MSHVCIWTSRAPNSSKHACDAQNMLVLLTQTFVQLLTLPIMLRYLSSWRVPSQKTSRMIRFSTARSFCRNCCLSVTVSPTWFWTPSKTGLVKLQCFFLPFIYCVFFLSVMSLSAVCLAGIMSLKVWCNWDLYLWTHLGLKLDHLERSQKEHPPLKRQTSKRVDLVDKFFLRASRYSVVNRCFSPCYT